MVAEEQPDDTPEVALTTTADDADDPRLIPAIDTEPEWRTGDMVGKTRGDD